jgi:hypothetical protein
MADRLTESGDVVLAFAYRWMARTGKRPAVHVCTFSHRTKLSWFAGRRHWTPPELVGPRHRKTVRRAELPETAFYFLPKVDAGLGHSCSSRASWNSSVRDLAFAIDKLRIILEGPK